jgi:hypothetical protein
MFYCGVKTVPQYGGLLSKVYLQNMHIMNAKLPAPNCEERVRSPNKKQMRSFINKKFVRKMYNPRLTKFPMK